MKTIGVHFSNSVFADDFLANVRVFAHTGIKIIEENNLVSSGDASDCCIK